MESKAKYARVGAAVVTLTVLFVVLVLWLSNIGQYGSYDFYTIYFKNQSLDGLQQDSSVTMKGVKIGSVDRFEISKRDIERVKVTLRITSNTPIKQDTRAIVRRNLLTGLATIDLRGSSQMSKGLNDVPKGEDYPVIPEGVGDFDAISNSLPEFLEKSAGLMERANALLSDKNIKHVNRTVKNFDQLSQKLLESGDDIRQMAKNFNTISSSLVSFTDKADKFVTDGGGDFRLAMQQVQQTAANIDQRTERLTKALTGTVNGLSLDVSHMTQEVTQAAQVLSATAEKFDEPQTILAGPSKGALGPGEKGSKRKDEE